MMIQSQCVPIRSPLAKQKPFLLLPPCLINLTKSSLMNTLSWQHPKKICYQKIQGINFYILFLKIIKITVFMNIIHVHGKNIQSI